MNDEIWLVFLMYAFAAAVVLLVMFYVIRGAILSALTEDRERAKKAEAKKS